MHCVFQVHANNYSVGRVVHTRLFVDLQQVPNKSYEESSRKHLIPIAAALVQMDGLSPVALHTCKMGV